MKIEKTHPHDFSATWALIKEDFKAHSCETSCPGFRALAVHRFGEWARNRPTKLINFFFRNIYWILHHYIRNNYGIEIMSGAQIGRHVVFVHQGGTVIHGASKIGDNCLIRHSVTLGALSRKRSKDAPTLKNNIEVCVGAVIIGKITVGENTIIGANSVVKTDVPANSIVRPPETKVISRQSRTQSQRSLKRLLLMQRKVV